MNVFSMLLTFWHCLTIEQNEVIMRRNSSSLKEAWSSQNWAASFLENSTIPALPSLTLSSSTLTFWETISFKLIDVKTEANTSESTFNTIITKTGKYIQQVHVSIAKYEYQKKRFVIPVHNRYNKLLMHINQQFAAFKNK